MVPYMLWLDLETTGLYGKSDMFTYGERDHDILEIAIMITDSNLEIKHRSSYIVTHCMEKVKSKCNDYVIDMHTKSGLFEDIEKSNTQFLYDIENEIVEIIKSYCGENKPVLAGSSIHFDRFFISSQMRRLNNSLFYRNFDISSIVPFYEIVTGKKFNKKASSGIVHRAEDDIMYSYETLLDVANSLQAKSKFRKTLESLL